jgi:hypothetical protein
MSTESDKLGLDAAKEIAITLLKKEIPSFHADMAILQDKTVDLNGFWVFFYNHRKWIEARDPKFQLMGNLPVAVHQLDGDASFVPRGGALSERLASLQARGKSKHKPPPQPSPGLPGEGKE